MHSRSLLVFALMGSFALPQPASAAPFNLSPEGIATLFKLLDKDGDGKLTGAELDQQPLIKRLDENNDGSVTLEEAQSMIARFKTPAPLPALTEEVPPVFVPENSSPRQQPRALKATEHGVGARVARVAFKDLEGKTGNLRDFAAGKPLVVAFVSSSCPVSKRYLPTLARLEKDFGARGVAFLLVAPTTTDSPAELRALLKSGGLAAPCATDPTGALAQALGALATTDVFVLDPARTLIYRGAIDDQYGLGYSLDAPRHAYLSEALEAFFAGTWPVVAATEAPGCVIEPAAKPAVLAAEAPTYHNRISRLVQANCLECHHSGGVAPFALETYAQVSAKAGTIRRMVERGAMPPWFAAPQAHSPWMNDRSLTESDKAGLLAWLGAGKPEGDPKDAPLARRWNKDWQIGAPDLVLELAAPFEIKESGTMPYQIATVETGLSEDRWVRGFEVKPTAREVVHHILIFVREKGKARSAQDGALGGFFAAYVPGNSSVVYPAGFAKKLPAGSQLIFQIHYTPNGTATRDQSQIGLLFSKEPPQHLVHVVGISAPKLSIPPGADNYPQSGSIPVPRAVSVIGYIPHMHVRGKAFRYEAILPGGEVRTLLEVPKYDFNWQLAYRYEQPPTLPVGTRVRATGWFDNSANNPANPDPTKTVRWGLQTFEEMMLGYVEYFFTEGEDLTSPSAVL